MKTRKLFTKTLLTLLCVCMLAGFIGIGKTTASAAGYTYKYNQQYVSDYVAPFVYSEDLGYNEIVDWSDEGYDVGIIIINPRNSVYYQNLKYDATSYAIPSHFNSNIAVCGIYHEAFANCTNLQSITLPDSLKGIGEYAFVNCTNLQSINVPKGVDKIGLGAFDGCTNLYVKIEVDTWVDLAGTFSDAFTDVKAITYQYAAPTGASWSSSGVASWTPLNNGSDYGLQYELALYKKTSTLPSNIKTVKLSDNVSSYDFSADMAEDGDYYFTVKAIKPTAVQSGHLDTSTWSDGSSSQSGDYAVGTRTVTFDANGHGTAPAVQSVNAYETATQPEAPTADGYVFDGWYTNAECQNKDKWDFSSDTVSTNITLYAKWVEAVKIGGVNLPVGKYMNSNMTVIDIQTADNYAYFKDGVLTLKNFSVSETEEFASAYYSIYFQSDLTVELIGENILAQGIYMDGGSLTVKAKEEGASLSIAASDSGKSAQKGIYGNAGLITVTDGARLIVGTVRSDGVWSKKGIVISNGAYVEVGSAYYGICFPGPVDGGLVEPPVLIIDNSTVLIKYASTNGIRAVKGHISINNSDITFEQIGANDATGKSGIYIKDAGDITVTESSLKMNIVRGDPLASAKGKISISGSEMTVEDSAGSGIWANKGMTILDSIITVKKTANEGLAVNDGGISVTNSTLTFEAVGSKDGKHGISSEKGDLSITNTKLSLGDVRGDGLNIANGALSITASSEVNIAKAKTSGIYCSKGITVSDSSIKITKASNEGIIAGAASTFTNADIVLETIGDSGTRHGISIRSGDLTMSNCSLTLGTVRNDGVHVDNGSLTMSNLTFTVENVKKSIIYTKSGIVSTDGLIMNIAYAGNSAIYSDGDIDISGTETDRVIITAENLGQDIVHSHKDGGTLKISNFTVNVTGSVRYGFYFRGKLDASGTSAVPSTAIVGESDEFLCDFNTSNTCHSELNYVDISLGSCAGQGLIWTYGDITMNFCKVACPTFTRVESDGVYASAFVLNRSLYLNDCEFDIGKVKHFSIQINGSANIRRSKINVAHSTYDAFYTEYAYDSYIEDSVISVEKADASVINTGGFLKMTGTTLTIGEANENGIYVRNEGLYLEDCEITMQKIGNRGIHYNGTGYNGNPPNMGVGIYNTKITISECKDGLWYRRAPIIDKDSVINIENASGIEFTFIEGATIDTALVGTVKSGGTYNGGGDSDGTVTVTANGSITGNVYAVNIMTETFDITGISEGGYVNFDPVTGITTVSHATTAKLAFGNATEVPITGVYAFDADGNEVAHEHNGRDILMPLNNGKHNIVWSCCQEIITENIDCVAISVDNDCTTAETCVCGYDIKAATEHDFSGAYLFDDDGHWHKCKNCSVTDTKVEHSATEDGDCTTEEKCSCGTIVIEAKDDHSFDNACDTDCNNAGCTHTRTTEHIAEGDDNDCTTDILCSVCDAVITKGNESHTGGTATCTAKAVCTVCGTAYGSTLPHTPEADDGDCMTEVKCSVCKTVTTPANTAHTGGTATCQTKAVCTKCGKEYGELDVSNHSKMTFIYTANEGGTTHTKKYECCELVVADNEAHAYGTEDRCVCGAEEPKVPIALIVTAVSASVALLGGGGFALWWFVFRKKKIK